MVTILSKFAIVGLTVVGGFIATPAIAQAPEPATIVNVSSNTTYGGDFSEELVIN